MKNIIFVINNINTGGVQSSLLNLLAEIHDKYHITLLCFNTRQSKEKLSLLPDDIRFIVAKSPFKYFGLSKAEARSNLFLYCARAFWAVVTKIFGRSFAIKLMLPFQKTLGTYDCAVSYLHEASQKSFYGGCNEFVLRKIKAKKKVAWLHCDFGLCGANSKASEKIYRRFDKIIACSEGTKQAFLRCMPQFKQKCTAIRNCNNYEHIRRLAGTGIQYDKLKFNIVTVARLSPEKGIERALAAIKECTAAGHKLHYHIVGWGQQAEYLKKLTEEYGLTDTVTFYGNRNNPYPYIKNADLFLLPSYHEAAPMVFDEAACLGVPVLATQTTSTDEMIARNNSGFVCENSQKGISNALSEISEHRDKLTVIKANLECRRFTNKNSIEKLGEIIDEIYS